MNMNGDKDLQMRKYEYVEIKDKVWRQVLFIYD